jgi:group I intron endonuclease
VISSSLKKVSGVYGFQLISTGEIVYVGSSVNLAKRFFNHISGVSSNPHLQNAFAKYGFSAFNFVILERYNYDWDLSTSENRDLLLGLEQNYIKLYQHAETNKPRYNICPNAFSSLGFLILLKPKLL